MPYITHPVTVATLVRPFGGTEDQVFAALLAGDKVFALVQFCTDGLPDAQGQKSPWRERKGRYLAHLRKAEGEGTLVCA